MSATSTAQALSRDWSTKIEPLANASDVSEYREAYESFVSGAWDDERWTAFRLRFGIYGQLQPGVQMIRVKVPGGISSIDELRAMARINREFNREGGEIHITTRQDYQLYYVPLERTPDFVEALQDAGMTSREACGNTLRNMNSCHLAGVCPREHVDAGEVALRLSRSWLRQPLVQHMPRKFKISVSGCATDCAASGIHDLGLIAVEKNGKKGFEVHGAGGTGGQPISAIKIMDFAEEEEIPTILEALIRLHQRYSNRVNRNAARIKFLVKRFGEDKFRALFDEEYARLRALPQRPWEALDWRTPEDAPEPMTPGGVIEQYDGKSAVVFCPALGLLTSDQTDALADLGEKFGAGGVRLTREQNMVITGLESRDVAAVVGGLREIGFPVEDAPGDISDVVSCPGTTTCRIGITNSQSFGLEVAGDVRNYAAKPGVTVRISGCQNGCGLHHVGDFGFRGMGKKIDGKNAPHYQIYVGGDARRNGAVGVTGPVIAARYAPEGLKLLLDSYAGTKETDEDIPAWAERQGKAGLRDILAPVIEKTVAQAKDIYQDWGEEAEYVPPAPAKSECAATFAIDDLLMDLADDALIAFDRSLLGGEVVQGRAFAHEGIYYAGRRLLVRLGDGEEGVDHDVVLGRVKAFYASDGKVIEALDAVVEAEKAADGNGASDVFREALALWIDLAAMRAEEAVSQEMLDMAKLDDGSGSVMDMIRSQQEGA